MVWKRRSSAPSFSIYFLYSSSVVAPMHCSSPRESAGLNILEASSVPSALPAPTMVCSSSMKMMTSLLCCSSFITALIRSSNCPRYLVPATMPPMSSVTRRLSASTCGTRRSTMRCARPSTIAVLPTPGSPISTGLFFLRRLSTWETRSISWSRPIVGSSLPSRARSVRSRPKWSRKGVLLFFFSFFPLAFPCKTAITSSFAALWSTPKAARICAAMVSLSFSSARRR